MGDLIAFERYAAEAGWTKGARPMDVGGWSGSYHSATLQRMERKGWVTNVGYGHSRKGGGTRRTCLYKSTESGRAAYQATTTRGSTDDEKEKGDAAMESHGGP